jgi:hypothetical protein
LRRWRGLYSEGGGWLICSAGLLLVLVLGEIGVVLVVHRELRLVFVGFAVCMTL